jgi:hypothetical protein
MRSDRQGLGVSQGWENRPREALDRGKQSAYKPEALRGGFSRMLNKPFLETVNR